MGKKGGDDENRPKRQLSDILCLIYFLIILSYFFLYRIILNSLLSFTYLAGY